MILQSRVILALLLSFAVPVLADPVVDSLFAEAVLEDHPTGQEIHYSHLRSGLEAPGFRPLTDGSLILVKPDEGAPRLTLKMITDGRSQSLPDFPVEGGNPVLLVFLESVSRSMADLTGGSPFYIRNRIKDALRDGGATEDLDLSRGDGPLKAQALTLHPFKDDPNRARMGGFADLALRFLVSDDVPGHILELSATAEGYHETIALTDAGKDRE
ncbi:hypothetical protein [Tabrizicola sp.]|uniref:hypothetical protein n=1 Tax=Tabrizicola sp. TaxID=2005166 RepID=UPI0035AE3B16